MQFVYRSEIANMKSSWMTRLCRSGRLWQRAVMALLLVGVGAGCVSRYAVPASRLPPALRARPRNDLEPINLIQLRQDPPPVYQLGPRDILGIYIEGVLGQSDQPPPVHFPERETNTPPAIGFPLPIREDGTIALPLIPAQRVSGLTLTQAEDLIRKTYIDRGILKIGNDRIIVTLIRKRTYQVLVVREDAGSGGGGGEALAVGPGLVRRGSARAVDLRAYENDVLHALSETGGMPGLDTKNEIKILRGQFSDAQSAAALLEDLEDGELQAGVSPDNPNLVRIPLRRRPNEPPIDIKEEDIILNTGDIVFIQTREREVYYTGGLLQGREHLLPRDYDLDVLGAIALANGSVSSGAGSGGGGGLGSSGGGGGGGFSSARGLIPPTEVIIVRKTKGGYQIPIKVNINAALRNPADRILIQPDDLVTLQYTPVELAANIVLNNLSFNYFLGRGLNNGS